jgi:hypothetical protein
MISGSVKEADIHTWFLSNGTELKGNEADKYLELYKARLLKRLAKAENLNRGITEELTSLAMTGCLSHIEIYCELYLKYVYAGSLDEYEQI